MPTEGTSVSDQVAAILKAAEETAEQIRQEAEARLRARVAEADRAAENRVKAAEDEAAEIIRGARGDAERIRKDAVALAQTEADRVRMEADELKNNATSEALAIVARAQENADSVLGDATAKARELLSEARLISGEVQADGELLAAHVRELGDSMRSNAARLLRDVQAVHSTFLAQVEKLDPSKLPLAGSGPGFGSATRHPASRGPAARDAASRGTASRGGDSGAGSGTSGSGGGAETRGVMDDLDVPEFIPRA